MAANRTHTAPNNLSSRRFCLSLGDAHDCMASRRLRPMISSLLRSHRANVFLEILWYAQLLGNRSQIGKFQYEQFEPAPLKGDPGFGRVAAPLAPFDNAAA